LFLGFLGLSLRVFTLEDDGQFGDGFLLPFGHQVRVKLVFGSNLGNGFGFAQGFQDNVGLESCRILLSWQAGSTSVVGIRFYDCFCARFCRGFRVVHGWCSIHLSLAHFAVLIYRTIIGRDRLEIIGTDAVLLFDSFDAPFFTVERSNGSVEMHRYPDPNPVHLPLVEALVRVYQGESILHVTGQEGRKTNAIVAQVMGSRNGGGIG
jgi:hypothetical protein